MRELIEGLFLPAFAGGGPPRPAARQRRGRDRRRPAGLHHRHVRRPVRCSFPAATSASWPSTARSTTWRWPGPGRCISARASSSKRACRWRRSAAWWPRWPRPAARPACGSSPATPRSSIAARATAFSSTRRASGWCRRASRSRRARVAARRRGAGQRRPGPARHGRHVGPRRAGLRGRPGERLRPAGRPGGGHAAVGGDLHCLRDLTRGGLAAALNEIALDAGVGIELDEAAIPVSEPVAGACELLGLDPLYVANEGRLVALRRRRRRPSRCWTFSATIRRRGGAAIIGRVTARHAGHGRGRGRAGGQPDLRFAFRRTDAANLLKARTFVRRAR